MIPTTCVFKGMPPENERIMVDDYRTIVTDHLAKTTAYPASISS